MRRSGRDGGANDRTCNECTMHEVTMEILHAWKRNQKAEFLTMVGLICNCASNDGDPASTISPTSSEILQLSGFDEAEGFTKSYAPNVSSSFIST